MGGDVHGVAGRSVRPTAACGAGTWWRGLRLWIVDGTLVPVRDRKVGASSRNYRFSANVQAIVYAENRLAVAAARPVPGNTTDAKAWRNSGPAQHCEGATVLGDGLHHAVQAVGRMHNLALTA